MADFQPLFKPTSVRPRRVRTNELSQLRAQFNIETWLLLGAVCQSILTIVLPLRLAILPAVVFLLAKIADAYAVKFNLKSNPHMANTIMTKFSAQLADETGQFGSTPARSSVAVFLIGARNNSPLGIFDPNFKKLGDYFSRMSKELAVDAESNGFLGSSEWVGTERASNATNMTLMYFRSAADVHAYAHGPLHREGWEWWYKNLAANKNLSIFHELYEVPSGNYETIYSQMSPMFMAATLQKVSIVEDGEKKGAWVRPVVDARKGQLKSSSGRMARSDGKGNDKYGVQDMYEDLEIKPQELMEIVPPELEGSESLESFIKKATHIKLFIMSAPNQGRQSPEPEKQSDSQAGTQSTDVNKQGGAPSQSHGKEQSDKQKTSSLESNPKGPLEDAAHEKTSKSS